MCKYFRFERPKDETPIPHVDDRFTCRVHGAYWSRLHGEYHSCESITIKYINPPRKPKIIEVVVACNRLHVDELPRNPGQGIVRSIGKLFSIR